MHETVEKVENAAQKRVGGAPVWVWAVGAVGVGVLGWWLFVRPRGTAATTLPSLGSEGLVGAGGATTTQSPAPTDNQQPQPSAPAITQAQWLQQAVDAATAVLNMPSWQARLYLQEYLAGQNPVGSGAAENLYEKTVAAALNQVGQPPIAPVIGGANANPFASNLQWLNTAMAAAAGASQSARQELVDLFNGRSTTLSPEAQTLLANLRDMIGFEPNPISYNTPQTPSPTPTPTPVANAIEPLAGSYQKVIDWYNTFTQQSGRTPTANEWVNAVSAFTGIKNLNAIQQVQQYGLWYVGATGGQRPDEQTWYQWLKQAQLGQLQVPQYVRQAQ